MQCVEERSGSAVDARQLLSALDAFKKGDFSVRLSANGGMAGKVAEAFNEVVELNERLVGELERISQVVGKAGRLNQRATLGRRRRIRFLGACHYLRKHAHQQSGPPDGRDVPRDRCRGERRPLANDGAGNQQAAAARRVFANREDGEPHGEPARVVRFRSNACGPRSGHRRQTRRPGAE